MKIDKKMCRVALIGWGALGRVVGEQLRRAPISRSTLVGVLVANGHPGPDDEGSSLPRFKTIEELLMAKPDIVIEAAGHTALVEAGAACLRAGSDIIAASVGALCRPGLLNTLLIAAQEGQARLLLPSGALGGLDYVRAARLAGEVRVVYRGRKPPHAWLGTQAEEMINLATITEATVLYKGNAFDAATRFPQNANVVAALGLAIGSLEEVHVELIADPSVQRNIHEVELHGEVGSMQLRVENMPSQRNPKSSLITAYSLLEVLGTAIRGSYQGDPHLGDRNGSADEASTYSAA